MAKKLYEEASVQDIAAAIREKNGGAETYKIAQMGNAVRGIACAETVEWHQCPEAVRNYLANVTYDPGDYRTSQIAKYAPATAIAANYRPIGKTLGGKTYCNEVPGIETPFASGGKAGTLKPLDFLRYIQTPAANVRDLGGWACDGGKVRYGLLFRGGYLVAADRRVLVGELGIRHDLDLRGKEEAVVSSSPLGNDVYFTCADDYAMYTLTPEDAWRVNLHCVFDSVTHGEPVFFHCAYGADRTGTLACVLEGLLGMSQSDIDKDYELTTFCSGSDTDANARRRNEAEWSGLISALNSKSGSTFRDKCVTFVAELGFTAAEINAYRKVMIDGTPSTVTPDIATFAVTNTIFGAATDNTAVEATQYHPYEATISAQSGKAISSVSVKMNGVDITAEVWRGEETNLYRKVTLNLDNCSTDTTLLRVIDGQSYGATVSANEDYTLDGAAVTITMGGIDVSKYYSGGKITIPKVTGDLVIAVSAVPSAHIAPNILTDNFKVGTKEYSAIGYEDNKRFSFGGTGTIKDNEGTLVTGYIPITAGMVIRLKPSTLPAGSAENDHFSMALYNESKAYNSITYIRENFTWGTAVLNTDTLKITFTKEDFPGGGYARICVEGAGADLYVTYNDEMPSAQA